MHHWKSLAVLGLLVPSALAAQLPEGAQEIGDFVYYEDEDPFTGEVTQLVLAFSNETGGFGSPLVSLGLGCAPDGWLRIVVNAESVGAVETVRWKIDDTPPSDPSYWEPGSSRDAYVAPRIEALDLLAQALPGSELLMRIEDQTGQQTDLSFGLTGLANVVGRLPCGPARGESAGAWRERRKHEWQQELDAAQERRDSIASAQADLEREQKASISEEGTQVRVSTCRLGQRVLLRAGPGGSTIGDPIPRSDVCGIGQATGKVLESEELGGELWIRLRIDRDGRTGWVPAEHVAPVDARPASSTSSQRHENSPRTEEPPSRSVRQEADDTERIITQHCRAEWDSDSRMRAYCERQQRSAVQELARLRRTNGGIPARDFQTALSGCLREWPSDYRMQAYCLNQQIEGHASVTRGPESPGFRPSPTERRTIQTLCRNEWPDDFRMQSHCEEQQTEALAFLKDRPRGTSSGTWNRVLSQCRREWPGDYRMQAYCVKRETGGR